METVKIRCKDLMVGDYIANRNGSPMQIVAVDEDNAYAWTGNEERPWIFGDNEGYEPQPITIAKILLVNNGWKEYGYLDPGYSYSFCSIDREGFNLVWKNEFLFISINSGEIPDMLSSVKYVHQLQQILRLYGLNELADNFKV